LGSLSGIDHFGARAVRLPAEVNALYCMLAGLKSGKGKWLVLLENTPGDIIHEKLDIIHVGNEDQLTILGGWRRSGSAPRGHQGKEHLAVPTAAIEGGILLELAIARFRDGAADLAMDVFSQLVGGNDAVMIVVGASAKAFNDIVSEVAVSAAEIG